MQLRHYNIDLITQLKWLFYRRYSFLHPFWHRFTLQEVVKELFHSYLEI